MGPAATAKGLPLGRKGAETYQRLLDTGRALIREASPFALTPVAICRAADLTSAAFYPYFPNIKEFLFQLTVSVTEEIEQADLTYLEAPKDLETAIARLIDGVHALYQEHRGILQYRNVLSEQGDARFLQLRTRSAVPRIEKLAALIEAGYPASKKPSRPESFAEAVFINAAIESLSASAQQTFEKGQVVSWSKLRNAQVRAVTRIIQKD